MRSLAFLFSCVLVFAACPADAARFSGSYLMQICDMDADGAETVAGGHAACQSYISGVLDYHNLMQSLNLAPKVELCVPERVTLYQLQRVVINYLRTNVQHDAFVAAPAVTMALYEMFPCE